MTRASGAPVAIVLSLSLALGACSPDSVPDDPVEATEARPSPSATSTPSPIVTVGGSFGSKHSPKPVPPVPVVTQTPLPDTLSGTWLGVLLTVSDPNKLDKDLKVLRRRYGSVVMTGQVFCWPGVNEGRRMADDAYFLAFITGSRPAAEALVADSGYNAEFYARVTDRCGG